MLTIVLSAPIGTCSMTLSTAGLNDLKKFIVDIFFQMKNQHRQALKTALKAIECSGLAVFIIISA